MICILGYIGGGDHPCLPDKEMPCDLENNCSPYGICAYNQERSEYECKCQEGYHGNGYVCQASQENELETTEKGNFFPFSLAVPRIPYKNKELDLHEMFFSDL